MKRIFAVLGILIVSLFLVTAGISCSGEKEIPATLKTEFTLSVGQTALISSEGLKLKFVKVTEDSRCPKGVECIQAGKVTCRVTVNYQGATSTVDMTVEGDPILSRGTLGNYRVLYRVQPYPESGKKIAESEYKLLLTVYK